MEEKTNQRLNELVDAEKRLREKLEHSKDLLASENTAKDTISESLNNKKYRLAVLTSNIDSSEKENNASKVRIVSLEDEIKMRQTYIEQVRASINIMYEKLNEEGADNAMQQEMNELIAQIKSSDSTKAQMEAEFQRLGDDRMRLSNELESLRGVIDKEEYILNKIDNASSVTEFAVTIDEVNDKTTYNDEGCDCVTCLGYKICQLIKLFAKRCSISLLNLSCLKYFSAGSLVSNCEHFRRAISFDDCTSLHNLI